MSRNLSCFIIFIFVFLLLPLGTQAQGNAIQRMGKSKLPERGLVIVAGGGVAAVKSDICGSPECNDLGLNVSVGAWYKLSPFVSLAGGIDYVRLGAEEKDIRKPRNVAFQSEVIEVTGTVVVNLLDSYAGSGKYRSSRKRFVVPYVRGGGGFVYYTPTSFPSESDLEDSQTTYDPERNYPAIAAVIPFGGGLRFRFSDEISVAGEAIYHITTTDYLDNIGPRLGSPGTDHYGVLAVKIMYTPIIKNKIFSKKAQIN
ncbi:thrombospondin type 3 repeat-containing protein [uncultured Pontibacter sp.]|uniref:thrombospondin type 3 repeat-containing protein n=1 Tax=uncultured Pontibacter sp. TaxID=453356 RepID=UPI002628C6A8|nr:thrombospondin type 3 repeat-containing protein [uncultured Pontibacter sp.]